jgi:ligand-binding sensor domain-containing protein
MNQVFSMRWLWISVVPMLAAAQQNPLDLGRWKNFTDMKVVRSVAAAPDSFWAATSGGLFLYTPSSNRFVKYTNSDGLSSNDLTAVSIDGAGKAWTGSSDGYVNSFDPRTGSWVEVRGIAESDRVQKTVRVLVVRGDSLYVGTDFGISVLQLSRMEFRDTYANLGFPTQAGVNDIRIHKNRLWVATDLGVSSAALDAPNLSAPTAWTTYTTSGGLPSNMCTAVAVFHDTIVVGTSSGLAMLSGSQFVPVASLGGKAIVDILERLNDLVLLWNENPGFKLVSYAGFNTPVTVLTTRTDFSATSLAGRPTNAEIWAGTTTSGIGRWSTSWDFKAPNGPQSNLFSSIAVDERGILWGASGISGRGQGFYRYDPAASADSQWKNYTVESWPAMKSNDYYKVSFVAPASIWVSSWGYGVVEVVADTIRRRLDQTSTPALAGSVAHDPNYVVVGGVSVDSNGEIWMVNRTAVNGNHVVQLKGGNSVVYRSSPSEGKFTNILIDGNDTKWFANSEPSDKPSAGLYYFNENMTVSGTAALGGWGWLTEADGLLNNKVLSLAVDRDGYVWVGTDFGLEMITVPTSPKSSRLKRPALSGQVIQSIAVDAVNNKWIGTKEGVIVVNGDATQVLAQYTVLSTNGKLVDNDVRTIVFDHGRGIAYFGTEKGLSSLEVAPIQTERSLSTLDLGPNPLILPSEKPLTIKNLADQTTIKVISTDGKLISEFAAQGGGRAFWNGYDKNGQVVPSGIYFIVAFAENGNQTAAAKLAVIRR